MAAINFPTATSNGQTFTADTGVIYTYVGTPPNGFWSGTFATQGLTTLDGRYIAKNDGNTRQTIQTQGLKFNNGSSDTILIEAVNSKIGIGTTSPASTLHINGSSDQAVTIQSTTTGADSRINFRNSGGTDAGSIYYKHNGNSLLFNVGGSNAERVRIASSGNVGIGTTSPSNLLHLNHTSDAAIRLDRSGTKQLNIGTDSSQSFVASFESKPLAFATSTSSAYIERMRISSNGMLGINETNPGHYIDMNIGTNDIGMKMTSTDAGSFIQFVDNGTSGETKIGCEGNNFVFDVNGSEKMRIDSSGRVGIGNTAPGAKLQIEGTSDQLQLTYTSVASYIHEVHSNGDYSIAKGSSERLRINSSGSVGIGETSIQSTLHVARNIADSDAISWANSQLSVATPIAGNSTANRATIYFAPYGSDNNYAPSAISATAGTSGASTLKFFTNASGNLTGQVQSYERMRIDSSGRVGIGTASPGSKLQIVDTVQATANGHNQLSIIGDDNGTNGESARIFLSAINATNRGCGIAAERQSSSNDHDLIFQTSPVNSIPAERLRITGDGKVGINQANPNGTLHVHTNSAGSVSASTAADDLVVENNGDCGITILTADGNNNSAIFFGTPADSVGAAIRWNDNANQMMIGPDQSGAKLRFNYGDGAEAMTIDSSGRLLIGTSSARTAGAGGHAQLQVKSPNSITTDQVVIAAKFQGHTSTSSSECLIACSAGYDITANDTEGQTHFGAVREGTGNQAGFIVKTGTSNTERMRITSSGYVLVGKTQTNMANAGVEIRPSGEITLTRAGDLLTTRRVSTEGTHLSFRNISGTAVGNIVTTSSATAYNTSSDYRLKENVELLTGAIPRVKLLPVKRFNFIGNDQTVDGFMAHEAAVVVPESVTGTYNEVDGDGNPVYQAIDQAKLVPLLTAALQEAISRIETLETEVAALKAA